MNSSQKICPSFAVTLLLSALWASQAFADRIDPSLIPPDVTLSSGAPSQVNTGAPGATAPGMSAGAAAPAQAAPAPAAQPATPRPGQLLPPGAVPSPPPPPTGSSAPPSAQAPAAPTGTFGRPSVNAPSNYSMFQTSQGSGPSASPDVTHDPIAVIETAKGTITIRLFQSMAPKTVANFVELAQKGFYNGLTFHRVEPNFCIQGGDPLGNGFGMYNDPGTHQPRFLALEVAPQLKHNAPGVVAMAHSGQSPNSASSQFYITLSPQPSLDGKYAIFGGVISGMNVVQAIVKGDKMNTVSVQVPQ